MPARSELAGDASVSRNGHPRRVPHLRAYGYLVVIEPGLAIVALLLSIAATLGSI